MIDIKLHGCGPEKGSRANPRWVAYWSYRDAKGKRAIHETLPISMADYSKAEAEVWAAENPPVELAASARKLSA